MSETVQTLKAEQAQLAGSAKQLQTELAALPKRFYTIIGEIKLNERVWLLQHNALKTESINSQRVRRCCWLCISNKCVKCL